MSIVTPLHGCGTAAGELLSAAGRTEIAAVLLKQYSEPEASAD